MIFTDFLRRRNIDTTFYRGAQIFLIALPIILLGWLVNNHYLLTPHLSYSYQPGRTGHVVAPKTPGQIIKTTDPTIPWRISVDSFLFHVTIPRLIEAVRVRVRLDPGTQLYTTLTASAKKGTTSTTIISAAALDDLEWEHVSSGNITLWMRDKRISTKKVTTGIGQNAKTKTVTTEQTIVQYDSVDDFRANPPKMNTVGLVGIERMTFATIKDYQPNASSISIGHTLRGSHQLYVYAANEKLTLSFDKIDLNRKKGADNLTVSIARVSDLKTSGRTWLKTVKVGDDGITKANSKKGKTQPVIISLPNVEPGVYFIDVATGEDVLLANMVSSQQYLSFNGRVFIADGPAYIETKFDPVLLRTNGTTLTYAAGHDQGKQEVVINNKTINVADVKINHVMSKLNGETTITFPRGDAIITSDGLLSFAGTTLLPDGAQNIDMSTAAPDLSAYDYILADYVPRDAGLLEVDQTYPLTDLALNKKTLTFSIDSPGMTAAGKTVGLKDIRVTLISGPFPWGKVWKKLGLTK